MGRKKKTNPNKKLISFLITFLMMASGVYYFGLNYVPQKWYEEQTMMPNQSEAYYVNQWCTADFGRKEAVLWDMTRVDCLAKDYAIEFDFAKKWAESIGQSLHYSAMTGKKPGIVLIIEKEKDFVYYNRIKPLCEKYGITLWYMKGMFYKEKEAHN